MRHAVELIVLTQIYTMRVQLIQYVSTFSHTIFRKTKVSPQMTRSAHAYMHTRTFTTQPTIYSSLEQHLLIIYKFYLFIYLFYAKRTQNSMYKYFIFSV